MYTTKLFCYLRGYKNYIKERDSVHFNPKKDTYL